MTFSEDEPHAPESSPDASRLYYPKVIHSPEEFVSSVREVRAIWDSEYGNSRPWFRGMPKVSFSLEPSLLRYRGRKLKAAEANQTGQFYQYAVRLLERPPQSRIEATAIMQHHGFATRLLDWSENAFAALYFAVKDHQYLSEPSEAVVWVLEPLRLTQLQYGQPTIPWGHDNLLDSPQLPIPFYPAHTSARLAPQRGERGPDNRWCFEHAI